jgi:hypothetical protein
MTSVAVAPSASPFSKSPQFAHGVCHMGEADDRPSLRGREGAESGCVHLHGKCALIVKHTPAVVRYSNLWAFAVVLEQSAPS